jgi:hypothetical protein
MNVIELHFDGNPRLIFLDKISLIGNDGGNTIICLTGDSEQLEVDESYDEIKNKLFKAGFVWNV